jgi:hypothetical protein
LSKIQLFIKSKKLLGPFCEYFKNQDYIFVRFHISYNKGI